MVMKTGCKPPEVFAERVQLAEQSEPQSPFSPEVPALLAGRPGPRVKPQLSSLCCGRNRLAFSKTFPRSLVSERFFLKSTVRGGIVSPPKARVRALTPSLPECERLWGQALTGVTGVERGRRSGP